MVDKVIISTDCVCDLPKDLITMYKIPMMFYYMRVGEVRFRDGTEINSDSILDYMAEGIHEICSMCATEEEYSTFFKKVSGGGKKQVIHIAIAKEIGMGYRNAAEAAKQFPEVHVIDSGMVSSALGALVLVAADMGQKGVTKDIILKKLDEMKGKINCRFMMRSANGLVRAKIISRTFGGICDKLSLHPHIGMKNSGFSLLGFCMGNHERCVTKYMKKCFKDKEKVSNEVVFVLTAGCDYAVQKYILEEVKKYIDWKNVYVVKPSATITCNSGSGTFGLAFYYK